MTMSSQRGLEDQLKEAGTKLLDPPTPVDELLSLLDHAENLLSRVDQSPAKSTQEAISPIVSAVIVDELLRHSNVDVKVAVASCISEITRISAPEAPYDDDKMMDVFQLIVSAFEGLPDEFSRSYTKRILILETVAQVRSCVIMLDLECDALIVEMFKIFLATIRDYHPKNVFSAMETIMALVLQESEDISSEILTPLLACMKKGNKEILPIAVKLAEKVFEKCAAILKPYLSEAIKSLEDYNEVVAAVCGGPPATVEPTNENANPLVQENVGEAISLDSDEDASGRPNVVMGNGVCDSGKVNHGTGAKVEDSVHTSEKGQDNSSADKLASKSEDGESATQKPLKVEPKVEGANTINSSTNASESSGTPHYENEEETPSLDFTAKKASKEKYDSDVKLRHSGEKATLAKKVKTLVGVGTSKKENKGMGDSEKKQMKQLGLIGKSAESKMGSSKKENKGLGDSEKKQTKQLGKKVTESSNTIDESLLGKTAESKMRRKTEPALEKEATKISAEGDLTPSTKFSLKSSKDSSFTKETPEMSSKRKHAASQEKATENEGEKQEKDSSDSLREVDAVVVSKSSVEAVNKEETPSLDFTTKKASKGKYDSDVKLRRSGEKTALAKKFKTLVGVGTSKKENKGIGDSDKKQMKQLGLVGKSAESKMGTSKKENKVLGDSEKKQTKQLGKKMTESSNTIDESLVGKSAESKVLRETKPALEKEATKVSAEDGLRKTPTKSSLKLSEDSRSTKETLEMSSKRKHAASQEKTTENNLDASLVGTRVKVWWPDDEQFYEGVIQSYDPVKKRHKVHYNDGDDEILRLKKERWHIIDDDSSEKQSAETSPEAASGPRKRGRPKKSDVSLKSGATSSRKAKEATTKHGHEVDEELELEDRIQKSGGNVVGSKQQSSDKRVDNSPKPSLKSKDAGGSLSKGNSKLDSPKASSKSKQDSAKTGVKPKTKAHQAGHDCSAEKIRNKEKVADVAKTSGKVKFSEMSKVQETEGSTKKRLKTG